MAIINRILTFDGLGTCDIGPHSLPKTLRIFGDALNNTKKIKKFIWGITFSHLILGHVIHTHLSPSLAILDAKVILNNIIAGLVSLGFPNDF